MYLIGQVAAVLGGHGPFQVLDNGGVGGRIGQERLRHVHGVDASLAAQKLVVRGLVDILEPAPAANVINQNQTEVPAAPSTSASSWRRPGRPCKFSPLRPASL